MTEKVEVDAGVLDTLRACLRAALTERPLSDWRRKAEAALAGHETTGALESEVAAHAVTRQALETMRRLRKADLLSGAIERHNQSLPPVRVVAAIVVNKLRRMDLRTWRVLLQQRPADKEYGGLWEIPGGRQESGEDDAATLRREFMEELGLELETDGVALNYESDHYGPRGRSFVFVTYVPKTLNALTVPLAKRAEVNEGEGQPLLGCEGQEVRWVPLEEALTRSAYNITPGTRIHLDLFVRNQTLRLAQSIGQ